MSEHASNETDNCVLLEVLSINMGLVVVVSDGGEEGSHLGIVSSQSDLSAFLDDGVEGLHVAVALHDKEVVEGEVESHDATELNFGGNFISSHDLHVGDDAALSDITGLNSSFNIEGDLVEVSFLLVCVAHNELDGCIWVCGGDLWEGSEDFGLNGGGVECLDLAEDHRVEEALMDEDLFSLLSVNKCWGLSWSSSSDGSGRFIDKSAIHVDGDESSLSRKSWVGGHGGVQLSELGVHDH